MSLCTPKLRSELTSEMLSVSYHGCLQTILLLLTKMGYEEVSLADRTDFVGRNNDGGVDIRGYRPVPGGRRQVVIQVKQYMPDKLIYRNHLDTLRGVVLREHAAEGVLITTSGFPSSLSRADYTSASIAPLRLIDAQELTDLMALHRVGVTTVLPTDFMKESRYRLDQEFFKKITNQFRGVVKPLPATRRFYTITIQGSARIHRKQLAFDCSPTV